MLTVSCSYSIMSDSADGNMGEDQMDSWQQAAMHLEDHLPWPKPRPTLCPYDVNLIKVPCPLQNILFSIALKLKCFCNFAFH